MPDSPPELVALGYHYRWTAELFFCWLKCILDCHHLFSDREDGVTLQRGVLSGDYQLPLSLSSGVKSPPKQPSQCSITMRNFQLMGWADEKDLTEYLDSLKPPDPESAPIHRHPEHREHPRET